MKLTLCSPRKKACGGFSLIEMIVAITVLGILSVSAAIFLRGPITSYFNIERRATLADTGGLAMAKLRQDIAGTAVSGVTVLSPPPGGGFSFRITVPPANVTYICDEASRTLQRLANGQNNLLAEGIWNCQARRQVLPPLGVVPLGGLIAVELNLRSQDAAGNDMGDRLSLVRTFRVGPLQ